MCVFYNIAIHSDYLLARRWTLQSAGSVSVYVSVNDVYVYIITACQCCNCTVLVSLGNPTEFGFCVSIEVGRLFLASFVFLPVQYKHQ